MRPSRSDAQLVISHLDEVLLHVRDHVRISFPLREAQALLRLGSDARVSPSNERSMRPGEPTPISEPRLIGRDYRRTKPAVAGNPRTPCERAADMRRGPLEN